MDEGTDNRFGIERMTHFYALRLLGHSGRELLLDALLDEQSGGRPRTLAVQGIDHENSSVGSTIEIGIRENNHWVLPAEFDVNSLQSIRPLPGGIPAGGSGD